MFHKARHAVYIACILLAACGGGGGGGGGNSMTTPTSPTPSPSPTPMSGPSATIADGGSTNRRAFTIVVQTNGNATVVQNGVTRSGTITATATAQFFDDLNANTPVANVVTMNSCTKSASYGSTTTLTYQGSTSRDISCPPQSNSPAQTLYNDVIAIENQLAPFTS